MTGHKGRAQQPAITFNNACDRLESVLRGDTRRRILDHAFSSGGATEALPRLRAAMRAHCFPALPEPCNLRRLVDTFEARSRREGLHVLEGWDYRQHRFPDDIVPVLLLDYCERLGIPAMNERLALAILLDQYFVSLLALLAIRAWDEGDANANLDRVTSLVRDLHGAEGSGVRVVEDADTLLILAIAYYNPEERSFGLLMRKVRQLDTTHQLRVALPFAGVLGSHLRWGLRFMYKRDVGAMREDNIVDYPMLLFAIAALLREYSALCNIGTVGAERDVVVEGLLNGLAADPWAFTGSMPGCLQDDAQEYAECRELLGRHREELLNDFLAHEPRSGRYSPLAFSCSFLSNAAVVTVAVAMGNVNAKAQASLNALFTHGRGGSNTLGPVLAPDSPPSLVPHPAHTPPAEPAALLAERLMEFSSVEPERLGWGGAPLIVHDARDAVYWFNTVRRTL